MENRIREYMQRMEVTPSLKPGEDVLDLLLQSHTRQREAVSEATRRLHRGQRRLRYLPRRLRLWLMGF